MAKSLAKHEITAATPGQSVTFTCAGYDKI